MRRNRPASHSISLGHASYPAALSSFLGTSSPAAITALGDPHILQRDKLALFCSTKCPGKLVVQAYDVARALRDAGITVIGGFHSPMERECLELLLRGGQPIIVCPARDISSMRVPPEWKAPLAAGRLLILSPFGERDRRVTADLAAARNEFVAAVADRVLIAYAAAGSKTEAFARQVLERGKPLLTLDGQENGNLVALGARPVNPRDMHQSLQPSSSPARTASRW